MHRLFAIAALVLLSAACAQMPASPSEEARVRFIDGAEAWKLLEANQAELLDVSTPVERTQREPELQALPRAHKEQYGPDKWAGPAEVRPEVRQNFIRSTQKAIPDTAATILVVCNVGVRSSYAAATLLQHGYTKVLVIRNGTYGEFSLYPSPLPRVARDGG